MNENLYHVLEGIETISGWMEEEKLRIAETFESNAGSPYALMWENLLKRALKAQYWQLAHLPKYEVENTAKISGRIAELEALLLMPENWREYLREKEEKKEKQEKGG